MTEMPGPGAFANAVPLAASGKFAPIGYVFQIAGASSRVLLDRASVEAVSADADPVAAAGGSVGSQIKMRVGASWLVANVRALRLEDAAGTMIAADIDFLGEGDEERLTGKLYNFRRGVRGQRHGVVEGARARHVVHCSHFPCPVERQQCPPTR